jgi:PhnB protein
MGFSPYLTFNGDCAEAFDFYKSVFGGEFIARQTFADGPSEMGVPDAEKERIMHVSLSAQGAVLMGSDTVTGQGEPATPTNAVSISVSPKTKEDADAIYAKLSEGGVMIMAMQDQFWGAYFGMCKDRYGFTWMLNVDAQQASEPG